MGLLDVEHRPPLPKTVGSISKFAENTGEVGTVGLADPVEGSFGLRCLGHANRVKNAGAVVGYLYKGGPPVAGIGSALDQAPCLEGINDFSGRARRDVQMARKLRQAHHSVAPQHSQSSQLGRADVPGSKEALGDVAKLARDGPESLRQRFVTTGVTGTRRAAILGHRNAAILGHRNRVPASLVVPSN